jgi:serine protease Do
VDGSRIAGNDDLIRRVSALTPGTAVRLEVIRDGRPMSVLVKLAERPPRDDAEESDPRPSDLPGPSRNVASGARLGMAVRELDREFRRRHDLPRGVQGVIVTRVEPMSPAFDAEIERGHVLLELNRAPVTSVEEYARLTKSVRPGDVLTVYLYVPERDQRSLRTVRVETP